MGEAKRRNSAGIRLRRLRPPSHARALTKLVIPAGTAIPERAAAMEAMRVADADAALRWLNGADIFPRRGA